MKKYHVLSPAFSDSLKKEAIIRMCYIDCFCELLYKFATTQQTVEEFDANSEYAE